MSSELAHALARALKIPIEKAEEGVAAIFREITLITNQGDTVRVRDFGTFRVVTRKERILRSCLPQVGGKLVTVPARRVLVFRAVRVRVRNRTASE